MRDTPPHISLPGAWRECSGNMGGTIRVRPLGRTRTHDLTTSQPVTKERKQAEQTKIYERRCLAARRCRHDGCPMQPHPAAVQDRKQKTSEFCAKHALKDVDMVNNRCSHYGCSTMPYFGVAGRSNAEFCASRHAIVGMWRTCCKNKKRGRPSVLLQQYIGRLYSDCLFRRGKSKARVLQEALSTRAGKRPELEVWPPRLFKVRSQASSFKL